LLIKKFEIHAVLILKRQRACQTENRWSVQWRATLHGRTVVFISVALSRFHFKYWGGGGGDGGAGVKWSGGTAADMLTTDGASAMAGVRWMDGQSSQLII